MNNIGKLLLRLTLGGLMLFHGVAKLGGVEKIGAHIAGLGLPAVLANLVYVGEIVAPILLIIGLLTRPAALVIAINMVVAIFLMHGSQLTSLTGNGGYALELQMFYLLNAIAIAMIGAGRYGIDRDDSDERVLVGVGVAGDRA